MRTVSFAVSITLHALIILIACVSLQINKEQIKLGINQEEILPSYTYQQKPTVQTIKQEKKVIPKAIPISKPKPTPTPLITKPATQPSKAQSKLVGNNKQIPELLSLLHAAIEAHKQYPAAAMEMEREGTVTLTFTLFPDGNIEDLHMTKSSGTNSLDIAAMAAVREAIPFKNINKYLEKPQNYQIDVVFELA